MCIMILMMLPSSVSHLLEIIEFNIQDGLGIQDSNVIAQASEIPDQNKESEYYIVPGLFC